MRQKQFEEKNQSMWDEFGDILKHLDQNKQDQNRNHLKVKLPHLYRRICNHYAISNSRRYSPTLITFLHNLVLQGHQYLYKNRHTWSWKFLEFIRVTFPLTLRQHAIYFFVSLLLFLLPALITGVSCYQKHELIYSIMDDRGVADIEFMYDPSNRKPGRSQDRGSDTNLAMFGYYIKNNIGIGFRTFAGGMLAGVGTLFFLIYNGVLLGGISGHLTRLDFGETFWPFVSGHGSFELTAIVISGTAGLMLAHKIVAPGNLKRIQALKNIAPSALTLIMGAAGMLLIAAFIEAFWSSGSMSNEIKYSAATVLWILVITYLSVGGKLKHAV